MNTYSTDVTASVVQLPFEPLPNIYVMDTDDDDLVVTLPLPAPDDATIGVINAGSGMVTVNGTLADGSSHEMTEQYQCAFFTVDAEAGVWRLTSEYGAPAAGGNVVGPASATDNHLAVFDGITGELLKDGGAIPVAGVGGSTGSTDNAILRADGAGGATLQGSSPTISDDGVLSLPNGTSSAPTFAFAGSATTGFYSRTGGVVSFGTPSGDVFEIASPFFQFYSSMILGWSSSTPDAAAVDIGIKRNAAGVMEVNSGTAAAFRDIIVRDAFLDGEKNLAALATNASGKIVVAASDARLKTIEGAFDGGLAEILAIEPQRFTWKDGRMVGMQAGLIAQNVQDAIPLAVSAVDDEMGTLQINKDAVIAALINAVKEMSARIEQLETGIKPA